MAHAESDSVLITLTLPVPPSVNRYWRNYNGRTVLSDEALVYKQETALIARTAGVEPLSGDVALTVRFYRARKSGDLDNRLKAIGDALNGIAYLDDKQIVEIHAYRHDDPENPRVEIEVEHR